MGRLSPQFDEEETGTGSRRVRVLQVQLQVGVQARARVERTGGKAKSLGWQWVVPTWARWLPRQALAVAGVSARCGLYQ